MIAAGVLALTDIMFATVISVRLIGLTVLAVGAFEIAHAFWTKGWGGFLWQILLGALYLAFGLVLLNEPEAGALILTYLLGALLLASGIIRCVLSFAYWRIGGSVPLFLFGTALYLFAMTSMGIFLATVGGSMPQFGLLLMLVLLPLQMLSGATTPRESMPEIIQNIMLAAPNTHFVILAQAVLFRGAGLAVIWPQLAALLVIGAALFLFSLRRFRRFLR